MLFLYATNATRSLLKLPLILTQKRLKIDTNEKRGMPQIFSREPIESEDPMALVRVNKLNTWLINEFPGEENEYKSVDSAMSDGEAVQYPVEFLNSLDLTGIPPHILKLKIGSPIMVLRSMEPPKTTNGTRCVVTRLHQNLIEATISCGPYKGGGPLSEDPAGTIRFRAALSVPPPTVPSKAVFRHDGE